MVLVWDVAQGKQQHILRGHSRPVTNMCLYRKLVDEETSEVDLNETEKETSESSNKERHRPLLLTGASDRLVCVSFQICKQRELYKIFY